MAARKEAPEAAVTPLDMGLSGSDMGPPIMSIVHTSSKQFAAGLAKFGDVVIGLNADDPDTEVIYSNQGGDAAFPFYVVGRVEKWYAMKFGQGDGRWDIDGTPRMLGDGSMSKPMPPNAELNYRYTLLVPSYSTAMPVHFYVKGTAERAMKGMVNKLVMAASKGIGPFSMAFTMATVKKQAGTNSWFVPDVALAEPDEKLVAIGSQLFAELAPVRQPQLAAGDDATDAPTF